MNAEIEAAFEQLVGFVPENTGPRSHPYSFPENSRKSTRETPVGARSGWPGRS